MQGQWVVNGRYSHSLSLVLLLEKFYVCAQDASTYSSSSLSAKTSGFLFHIANISKQLSIEFCSRG